MERALIHIRIDSFNIQGTGSMGRNMEKGNLQWQMEAIMMETSSMAKFKEKESEDGRVGLSMTDSS